MPPDLPYRWILKLLPPSFREEYEGELLRTWRALQRASGPRPSAGWWMHALADTLWIAPREYATAGARNAAVALRQLRRTPAFAAAAILTLAVGMGATAGVFTLINAVLLRPLPFRAPGDVGLIWAVRPDGERTWLSFPELEELHGATRGLEGAAGVMDVRMPASAGGVIEEVQGVAVSHGLFRLLGVPMALGRDFDESDDRTGSAAVVVLSDAFWRTRLGADPRAVGTSLRMNDRDYLIVGVLPPAFSLLPASSVLPGRVDVWLPLEPHLPSRERSVRFLHALTRLRPGVTFGQAAAQMRAHASDVTAAFPAAYQGGSWTFTIVPFQEDVLRHARTTLLLLLGLVTLVLLMACVNVTHLLLARVESRRTELAVRAALGAGPARLAGEQLAEVWVLACGAAVLGSVLALATPAAVRSVDPHALPRLADAVVDARVAAFMLALAVLTMIVSAAAPIVERLWLPPAALIESGRSGGRTRRGAAIGKMLVIVQTAFATTVIVTAVLLVESLLDLHRVDLGLKTAGMHTARVSLSPQYPVGPAAVRFFERATSAIAERPGVAAAAAISQLPLSGAMLGSTFLVGSAAEPRQIDGDLRAVTTNYFAVAGTPLLAGRPFSEHQTAAGQAVAIVDETFARRMHPEGRVLGTRIRWFRQPEMAMEIVGVAAAVRHRGPAEAVRATVYRPLSQYPRTAMFVLARTIPGATLTYADLRAALDTVDPTQPLADVSTMSDRVDRVLASTRTTASAAALLGTFAVALGAMGLYGVLSVGIAQRLREFGVRLALGATPTSIRVLVLREGLALTGAGILAGALGAGAVAGLARSKLLGVVPETGVALGVGVSIVLVCSMVALWPPARRAAAAEPTQLLRAE